MLARRGPMRASVTRPSLLLLLLGIGCAERLPITEPDDDAGPGVARESLLTEEQEYGAGLPEGYVSLTYDDGPGYSTMEIARFLERQGIPATFFVNGCGLTGHPTPGPGASAFCLGAHGYPDSNYPVSTLGALVDLGHRIANHTQDHAGLGARTMGQRVASIRLLQETLEPFIEDELWFFRPPGTEWPVGTASVLNVDWHLQRMLGPFHHMIPGDGSGPGLSCPQDWSCLDGLREPAGCARQLLECAFRDAHSRGVIMLHDRRPEPLESDPRYRWNTYLYTQTLITELRRLGYTFVPLDAIPGILGPRRFDFARSRRTSPEFSNPRGWDAPIHALTLRTGDIDGDGRIDVCGRGNGGIRCLTVTRSGLVDARTPTDAFANTDGFAETHYAATMMMGDIDRDGDDDVCMRRANGVYCARGVGRGTPLPPDATRFSTEFSDGDGWDSDESRWGTLRLVDVTRDRRADLCGRRSDGIVCAASRGSSFRRAVRWSTELADGTPYAAAQYSSTLAFGDIDGDGDADFCFRSNTGIRCALNMGFYFTPSREWIGGRFSDLDRWDTADTYGSIQLVDVDGDGDADICGRATTGLVCAFSNGSEFRGYRYLANQVMRNTDGWNEAIYGATMMFEDFDADGVADVCARSAGGLVCAFGLEDFYDTF